MKAPLLILALMFGLTGCETQVAPSSPRPDAKPAIAAQGTKDAAVVTSANAIDTIAAPSPIAAPVKVETDNIRRAVAEAPAADVSRIVAAFEAHIARLDKQVAAERSRAEKAESAALREQARWLTWTGVGLLASFGLSLLAGGGLTAAVKTWPLALLGAGCFGLAQLISHPWFLHSFGGLFAASLAYVAYWVYDRHKQGRLREALAKREALLKSVVPVLDEAYESASDSLKEALDSTIFNRLAAVFSKDQKAEIHRLRADTRGP
jgi:hypothetical protein